MRSLSARLLFSITILLLIFFTLTALVLDRIFRDSAQEASAARLVIQRDSLFSAIDFDTDGNFIPPLQLSEARFNNPGSGLVAFIARTDRDEDGRLNNTLLWKSSSAVGLEPELPILAVGSNDLRQVKHVDGRYIQDSSAWAWELANDETQSIEELQLVVTVAESLEPYSNQLTKFRTQLFSWFAGLIFILLGLIGMMLRRILRPLRRVEDEVAEIDAGKREFLSDDYPSELEGVAENTNALIKAERSRLERYRNTLGNLAHSLKTPLAVIKTSTESETVDKQVIQDQVEQMNDIVGYQLKRAVTAGSATLGREPIAIGETVKSLVEVMGKVHFDKGIEFNVDIPKSLMFYGDKGDLTELLGNLIDNASKWCKSRVNISAHVLSEEKKRSGFYLSVEDDGKGIAQDEMDKVLKRGQRADEKTPGYGIGLSIVQEIVQSYNGQLDIERSELGGAKFVVELPAV